MNDPTPIAPVTDGIEEGKRLVRIGGDKGLSLAERIADRFMRLTWRTPIHTMRLRGRHPLRLIAVVDDPFLGDPARGNALLDGELVFRGERLASHRVDFADPKVAPAFVDYLQSFAWLRDLSTVATRTRGAPIAEGLTRLWLAAHAERVSDPTWRADIWGRRILAWTAHAPLILSSTDLVYRSAVLHALARGARHIDRAADRVAPGTPRIAAWSGVIAAGLLIPGGEPRRSFGEAGLARALGVSLFDDGGTLGRSPAGLLDAIMLLASLRACYAARRFEVPGFVERALAKMVPALLGVCHGDRGLSSWQGGAPVPAETVEQIVAATGVRTRPLRQAREWGYQRLSAGNSVLIIDAAPPPVARLIEGGCASTLALEFSDGPDRIIVSCGAARAADARVPAALLEGLRTTAAHSTVVLADSNSTAIHADGTLGRGVVEVELSRHESDSASRIEASHDGYVRRHGFIHRRRIALSADGRDVRGEDMLHPVGKGRRKGAVPFAARFHLHPAIETSPTADGQAAILRTPSGAVWQFRCRGGALSIEDSVWMDARGRPQTTGQIVVSGETPAGGTSLSWLLHRAR